MKSNKKVLITDLDNTLFDWVHLWHACFSAMLEKIIEISGVSEAQLKTEIRQIHQKHGTSEYAFLIEEIPSLKKKFPNQDLSEVFAPAIQAFRIQRRKHLELYPTVADSLLRIKGTGAKIVGYTESMEFYSNYRVRRLGMDGIFDLIFSPEDHDLPNGLTAEQIRRYPATQYEFDVTEHERTPKGKFKPNKDILLAIIQKIGAVPEDCVYVGDSLFKDVAMANDAAVDVAWAKYGQAQSTDAYKLLKEVTHWTDADVAREQKLLERSVKPSIELSRRFDDLFGYFKFGNGSTFYDLEKPTQLPIEERSLIIDVWKSIVDVQKHFNDIEMRIRSVFITVVLGLSAGYGYLLDKKPDLDIGSVKVLYATFVPFFGIVTTLLFYFLDRHWYHRLLVGSVNHAIEIEKKYAREMPELSLSASIGKESPVRIRGLITRGLAWLVVSKDQYKNRTLRSDGRIEFFYKSIVALFVLIAVLTVLFGGITIGNSALFPWIRLNVSELPYI